MGEREALVLGKELEPREVLEQMLQWDEGKHNTVIHGEYSRYSFTRALLAD